MNGLKEKISAINVEPGREKERREKRKGEGFFRKTVSQGGNGLIWGEKKKRPLMK